MGDHVWLNLEVWYEEKPVVDEFLVYLLDQLRQMSPDFEDLADNGHTADESKLDYFNTLTQFSSLHPDLLFCMSGEVTQATGIDALFRDYYKNGKSAEICPIWPEFTEEMLT